jgi:gas vesicle protein
MVTSWKIIVATLVIYIAGLVTGTYLTDLRESPRRTSENRRDPSSPRGPRMHDFIQRFGNELSLSEQQRTNITQILKTSQERMDVLMKEMQDPIREEFSRVNGEIKAQLSDEQNAQFEKIMEKRRSQRGRGGFGPGGPGPGRGRGNRGQDPNHQRPHGDGPPPQFRGPGRGPNGEPMPGMQPPPPSDHTPPAPQDQPRPLPAPDKVEEEQSI